MPLGRHPAAIHAVHDLELRDRPGRRAEEPRPPRLGLFVVSGVEERIRRERGVAEPAVTVIQLRTPPMCSGRPRVGAAAIAPVGWKLSAFSVRRLRRSSRAHGPRSDPRADQRCHVSSVRPRSASPSSGEPVDRAAPRDERRRPAITEQCVVFDARTLDRHPPPSLTPPASSRAPRSDRSAAARCLRWRGPAQLHGWQPPAPAFTQGRPPTLIALDAFGLSLQ